MKFTEFLRRAFSENNVPSAKRVIGGLMIVVVLFCTVWSCVKYGMTTHVTSVIETEIITAGALLGVSSVTSIWKGGRMHRKSSDSHSESEEDEDEES
jgi:hypothetical protein